MSRALTCLLLFSTVAAPARADEEEDLIHRGNELRKKGRDAEALDLFRKAFALNHSPRADAQVGLAEQALGNWVQAEVHLKNALITSDPWVQQHQAVLDGALKTIDKHLGSLMLSGGVPGATVLVDGVATGTLPIHQWLRVTPGEHRLDVTKSGYAPFSARPSVSPGQLVELNVLLTPLATPAATPAPGPSGSTAPIVDDGPAQTNRRALWIGLGAGAAVVVVAAVVLGVVLGRGTDYGAQARGSCTAPCMVYEVK